MAHVGFLWFLRFMKDQQVLDEQEYQALTTELNAHSRKILEAITKRCSDEQNGYVFVDTLRELLSSGQVIVEGLVDVSLNKESHGVWIGRAEGGFMYILAGKALAEVKRAVPQLVATKTSMSTQMTQMGLLVPGKGLPNGEVWKKWNGLSQRVWQIDLQKFGYDKAVSTAPRIVQAPRLELDSDGLI